MNDDFKFTLLREILIYLHFRLKDESICRVRDEIYF